MQLYLIPHLMAVLTFVGINVCFVIAASSGHIPWCFPYVEGCVSISKASRNIPEVQIYRIAIMSTAILMIGYWVLCGKWLKQLCNNVNQNKTTFFSKRNTFVILGVTAGICLAINSVLIGNNVDILKDIRRICVAVFFSAVILAQCIFALELKLLVNKNKLYHLNNLSNFKIALCAGQLLLAILSLGVAPFLADSKSNIENMGEWNIVLLMLIFFISTGISWKQTSFQSLNANMPTSG